MLYGIEYYVTATEQNVVCYYALNQEQVESARDPGEGGLIFGKGIMDGSSWGSFRQI